MRLIKIVTLFLSVFAITGCTSNTGISTTRTNYPYTKRMNPNCKFVNSDFESKVIEIATQISIRKLHKATTLLDELKTEYSTRTPNQSYLIQILNAYFLLKNEDYLNAEFAFRNISNQYPLKLLLFMNSGIINLKHLEQYHQADSVFTKAIELIEYYPYGEVLSFIDQEIAGTLNFNKYVLYLYNDRNYKLFMCYYLRSEARFFSGNLEGAISDLDNCLKIDPKSYHVNIKMGNFYRDYECYEKAIHKYTNCINIAYMTKLAKTECGLIYYKIKEYDKAVETISEIINQQFVANNYLIEDEEDIINGKIVQASKSLPFDLFLRSRVITYNIKDLYYIRGRSFGILKEYNKAVDDLTEVINLDPDHETAYYYRAYFSNYSGNKKQALSDFQKVIELNPARTDVLYSIALIHDTNADYEKALKSYTEYFQTSNKVSSKKYKAALDRVEKLQKHLNK